MNTDCIVYRCARQAEMYLYLRADLPLDTLPPALRQRTGALTEVMRLALNPQRRLARVETARVLEQLAGNGWYLQLPPDGNMQAHLHFGDGL